MAHNSAAARGASGEANTWLEQEGAKFRLVKSASRPEKKTSESGTKLVYRGPFKSDAAARAAFAKLAEHYKASAVTLEG